MPHPLHEVLAAVAPDEDWAAAQRQELQEGFEAGVPALQAYLKEFDGA